MKKILDVCCGSKMFWFDKHNPYVTYCDNRKVQRHEYYPKRYIEICPDTVCDFTNLPFPDGSYQLVVFDPPHLIRAGDKSWLKKKYGMLEGDWRRMLHDGFDECFRVLADDGIMIFKWSEIQVPLRDILPLSPYPPLFGHRSGKSNNTHWLCFMKFSGNGISFNGPITMNYTWIEPDRARDKDNIAFARKFIQDSLVKFGYLRNDGWKHILGFSLIKATQE